MFVRKKNSDSYARMYVDSMNLEPVSSNQSTFEKKKHHELMNVPVRTV